MIVLHYTAMPSASEAIERLCDRTFEVSAHYVIARDGQITQLVDEAMRAWHAGAGVWQGAQDINSRSIGIELDNDGTSPFAEPLMAALERLMPGIMARWSIDAAQVIGHSDMAPMRKIDPGPRFDWRRLARQGLAVWPQEGAADAPLADSLARFGYGVAEFGLEPCLSAFRTRFRPGITGAETPMDRALAADLAARFAIDRGGALA